MSTAVGAVTAATKARSGPPRYSAVIPAFNEAESLPELVGRVDEVFRKGFGRTVDHEIIVIDDGSVDDTQNVLVRLCAQYPQLRAVILRRNSGKSMALMAGFAMAHGDFIVTLDADLQDNPEDIPALVDEIEKGYDLVIGRRKDRNDTVIRRFGSRVFNWAVRRAAGVSVRDMNSGFKIYKAEVIRNIAVYGQFHRFIPLLAHSYGFKIGECPVRNSPRRYGTSKFTTLRYQGLFDLLSLLFIHKYHLSPLHFFAKASAVFTLPSGILLAYFVVRHTLSAIGVGGQYMITERPLLSISLTMFLIGINVLLTGFICDFILHHFVRSRREGISDPYVAKILGEADGEVNEWRGSRPVSGDN